MIDSYPLTVERLSLEDGGGFAAYALDLPGCMSDGDTEAEARENGRAAVRDWLAEARRLGRRIPEPKVVRSPIDDGSRFDSPNGHFVKRNTTPGRIMSEKSRGDAYKGVSESGRLDVREAPGQVAK